MSDFEFGDLNVINLGISTDISDIKEKEVKAIDYLSIISKAPNFISLDISVNSTGWVKWHNGELTYGTYGLIEKDELERRQEFKRFLRDLFGDDEFEFVSVEDTIGSCNYKVLKFLVQLNSIVDDMKYDKIIKVSKIIREDNKVWKKLLHKLSGIKTSITKCNDKILIVECMNALGFLKGVLPDSKTFDGLHDFTDSEQVKQDVYDALGMALGIIYRDYLGITLKKAKKVKTDIRKGYKIKQFDDLYEALDEANELSDTTGRRLQNLDFTKVSRDLVYNFKKSAEEYGDEKLFVITVPTTKLGSLAIDKDLSLDGELSYLLVYR